jgi:hypothetical protein
LFICVVDNSRLKSIQGAMSSLCNDYGWINELVFFNTDVLSDNMHLNIRTNILALVKKMKELIS